jgi:hypothetical protein
MGLVLVAVLGLGLIGCATPQQQVAQKEDYLAAAGFTVRPANTPARQKMLISLPSHRFVQRPHKDSISYIYADPLVCNCLYVGSQMAYDQYKLLMQQQHMADEQAMTAQMYANPNWDWGAWGPYGPDFGAGLGW